MNARFYGILLTLISIFVLSSSSATADNRDVTTFAKPAGDPDAAPLAKPVLKPREFALWKWSLYTYAGANVTDVISSVGPHHGHETNSLLRGSDGNFHVGKAIAVKGGVFALTGIAEYLIIRKWPQLTKVFTVVNFGWSGAEAGVAANNFRLRK